jgi:hypothetical protein
VQDWLKALAFTRQSGVALSHSYLFQQFLKTDALDLQHCVLATASKIIHSRVGLHALHKGTQAHVLVV